MPIALRPMESGSRHVVAFLAALLLPGAAALGPQPALAATVSISVDAGAAQHPISPLIYGISLGTATQTSQLNCGSNRLGGNHTSTYNWQVNAFNRGEDWYFESISDSSAVTAGAVDRIIADSRSGAAEPLITVPMLGWMAKLGNNRSKLASFSVAKYGAQTDTDAQWMPDAGNGILLNGSYVTGNDPNDAQTPSSVADQGALVQYLVNKYGSASQGGIKYYILDNEHTLWHSAHRDVHPTGANMEEIRDKMIAYAAQIKSIDPNALTLGPEEWGWNGFFYSGYDLQVGENSGWNNLPDRAAHGDWDYIPWLLDQFRQHNQTTGQRVLDVLSVHWYPQGGEYSTTVTTTMQLKRNRSTRALWDANYLDESWIADYVKLIPRLKAWVNTYYPGTKIALTEYNWGATTHINGATTQADILGILGREGVDIANRWTAPDATSPTYKAMQLYRNYDGQQSTFGDVSVQAATATPDQVSAFAALRSSDNALTVMVINKDLSVAPTVNLGLNNFSHNGTAQVWQLTSSNVITRLADVTLSGNALSMTVPVQSMTLFVVPSGSIVEPPPVEPVAAPTGLVASIALQTVTLRWRDNSNNEAGFYIERSPLVSPLKFVRVGQVVANQTSFAQTLPAGRYVFRVQAFATNPDRVSAYSAQVSVRIR